MSEYAEYAVPVEPVGPASHADAAGPSAAEPGVPYHLLLTAGPRGAWRPVLGTAVLAAIVVVVAPFLWLLPFAVGYVVAGGPWLDQVGRLVDLSDPTPAGLAYLNLVLASAIPATWLVVRVLHRTAPRWLSSVAPRIRWRWFFVCLGLAVVALAATLAVSALIPQEGTASQLSGEVNDFTARTRDFVVVLLLLTPLQAAGEEYAFRGYLTQAFGGLFRHPLPAVIGPAVLFALAHGGQSAPIFFDRFAFGLVAGTLVILTGGLEAGLAMHVLNNWLAFGLGLAFGDMASTLNPTGGTWWSIPVTLTQSLVFLGIVLLAARRSGVARFARPEVLAASSGRV